MLATVTSLMPSLQAIPLHVDSAKNSLLDTLRKQTHYHTKAIQTSTVTQMSTVLTPNKRSRTMSDNLTALTFQASKRPREEPESLTVPSRSSMPPTVNKHTGTSTPRSNGERHQLVVTPRSSTSQQFDRPQTPCQKGTDTIHKAAIHASLTPAGHCAAYHSPRLLHIPTLGDLENNTNSLQTGITAISKVPLNRLTSIGRKTSIQILRTTSSVAPVSQDESSLQLFTKKAEVSIPVPKLSGSTSQQTNTIKRSTTRMIPPRPKTMQQLGAQVKSRFIIRTEYDTDRPRHNS